MTSSAERRDDLRAAQTALLERFAPDAQSRHVRWSGGETQVLELGHGRPMLLVHGGLDNAFTWAPILQALAPQRRVIAIDLPGHGLADPFDFRGADLLGHARKFTTEILNALDVSVVDVVASSIGAIYAVELALTSPKRVSTLVLVGAPAGTTRPGAPLQLRVIALPVWAGDWGGD